MTDGGTGGPVTMAAAAVAVVTGASGGIGEELAWLLAKDGHDLFLIARSGDKLEKLASDIKAKRKVAVTTLSVDLGGRDATDKVMAALDGAGLYPSVLVNNAGYGAKGAFHEGDGAYQLGMIDLNIYALTALTRAMAPGMVERGAGKIINIASTASFLPGPRMAVYYATKAYVLSFSEAVQFELKGTGVSVTAVCPGPTATGFQEAAELVGSRLVRLSPVMSARRVARIGYRAAKRGQAVVITGLMNRLQARSMAFTPRGVKLRLVNFLQK